MKDFVTAVKSQDDLETLPDVEFTVDGRKIIAHGPLSGQFILMVAAAGDMVSTPQAVATSINFVFSLLDDDDNRYLKVRLFDKTDPFDAESVADIFTYLIEEWSGKAGQSRPASAASRRNTGRASTAKPRGKVSSR